jgi:hypothetical protein
MLEHFPFRREIIQIAATSVGLAIFVSEGWISQHNSFLSNFFAGIALYCSARVATWLISRH